MAEDVEDGVSGGGWGEWWRMSARKVLSVQPPTYMYMYMYMQVGTVLAVVAFH